MNQTLSHLPPQSVLIGAGLLTAAAVAVALGRARRVPAADLLAVFGGSVVLAAITSRLFWLLLAPSVDLQTVLQQPALVADLRLGGNSSFGALAGAAVVVGAWVYRLRNQQALAGLDALVTGGLAGLALARLGCASNGCDFGSRADLAWAIAHPSGTDAFAAHIERGWVGVEAAWSLSVHPFALYLAGGTLLIVAWASWAVYVRSFAPGRVAMWASGAYLVLRFVAEWTRDEATVIELVGGFNVHHLFCLVGLGLLAAIWWNRNWWSRKPAWLWQKPRNLRPR